MRGVIVAALVLSTAAFAQPHAACTPDQIHQYEAMLGVHKGGFKAMPQLGFTIQYLGTEPRKDGSCAIVVRRAD